MVDFRRGIGTTDPQKLCNVVAFDPGETTGWCVMGISESNLDGLNHAHEKLQDDIAYINYGQIDCIGGGNAHDDQVNKHAGIAFGAEAFGVGKMFDLIMKFPNPAIVVEDFVPDMHRMDQARHTLSPVRIMSMLSYAMYVEAENTLHSRVFVQNRSMPKTTCTDDRLRRWGLYDAGGGRHARDATRHAFYFLRTCRGQSQKAQENRWRAWPEKFDDPAAGIIQKVRAPRKKKTPERVRFA